MLNPEGVWNGLKAVNTPPILPAIGLDHSQRLETVKSILKQHVPPGKIYSAYQILQEAYEIVKQLDTKFGPIFSQVLLELFNQIKVNNIHSVAINPHQITAVFELKLKAEISKYTLDSDEKTMIQFAGVEIKNILLIAFGQNSPNSLQSSFLHLIHLADQIAKGMVKNTFSNIALAPKTAEIMSKIVSLSAVKIESERIKNIQQGISNLMELTDQRIFQIFTALLNKFNKRIKNEEVSLDNIAKEVFLPILLELFKQFNHEFLNSGSTQLKDFQILWHSLSLIYEGVLDEELNLKNIFKKIEPKQQAKLKAIIMSLPYDLILNTIKNGFTGFISSLVEIVKRDQTNRRKTLS